MVKLETKRQASIKNFKRCISLVLLSNVGIDCIYAPLKPVLVDNIPIVYVQYDHQKVLEKMPINEIIGYDSISDMVEKEHQYKLGIDYKLFDYTKYIPSIDTVLNNTVNEYKTSLDYKKLKRDYKELNNDN